MMIEWVMEITQSGEDGIESEDVSNEPAIRRIFDAALEFLRLVGSGVFENKEKSKQQKVSQSASGRCHVTAAGTKQEQAARRSSSTPRAEKKSPRQIHVTQAQRRKLERIKAPVTIFRKRQPDKGLTEKEQETSVNQTLEYLQHMPKQEQFQPPPVPMVTLDRGTDSSSSVAESEKDSDGSREKVLDYEYLSSEREVMLWKLLLSSPTNCNVFVGNLSHQVTGEVLMVAFGTFCFSEEDRLKLKTHVVKDAIKHQSRGYGFVNFPQRRPAEMALICMQEFEVYGRSMQLGWGQETRDNGHMSSGIEASKPNTGRVVSDKVYSQDGCLNSTKRQVLKRKGSRWDQHAADKIPREDSENSDVLQRDEQCLDSAETTYVKQHETENKRKLFGTELKRQNEKPEEDDVVVDKVNTGMPEQEMETEKMQTRLENTATKWKLLKDTQVYCLSADIDHRTEQNCQKCNTIDGEFLHNNPTPGVMSTVEVQRTKQNEANEIDSSQVSSAKAVDNNMERKDKQGSASESNKSENEKKVECTSKTSTKGMKESDEEKATEFPTSRTSRKDIHWLTHGQRVSLLRSVCSRLREAGVTGHLGVFRTHYEADNSRLYVVCAKNLTEAQISQEFIQFGPMEVKLNTDANGISKGCAFVQYSNSKDAETAMKQLHGKALGGRPLKVMVAEPKTRKGPRQNRT